MTFRHLFPVALLLAAEPAMAATPVHSSCDLPAALRQRLAELDPENTGCRDSACLAAREKEARELLAEFPGQPWAARLVQLYEEQAAEEAGTTEALREHYRLAAAAAPGDATAQYLWGRLESGPAAAGFARALALDPAHPLVRLGLAKQKLAAKDPENMRAAGELIGSFAASCPARAYVALQLVEAWPQADFWLPLMDGLRSTLAERPPLEQAAASLLLWTLEFKLRPAAEHAALREKVAAELPRIDKLGLNGSLVYWDALRSGSEATGGDPASIDRRQAEFFPCERSSVKLVQADLRIRLGLPADPRQKTEPTPEQRAALRYGYRALAERCPHEPMPQLDLFAAALGDPQAKSEELAAIGEKVEAAIVRQLGRTHSLRPIGIFVARNLLDRRAGPATAQRLVATSREKFELTRTWLGRPEAPPVEDFLKNLLAETDGLLAAVEARAWLQLEQPAKAAEALAKAHALLAPPSIQAGEGRDQFAKARQEMLAGAPDGRVPPELPPPAPVVQEGIFEKASFEFAGEFPLDDPRGRTWQKVELAGKTWLVNLWATWCGPCMAELPHIQKLHEELKGRQDVGVMTLNFDREVGKVQPFLDRQAYTFPVLLAAQGFEQALKDGIPQNWLVDAELKLHSRAIGFDAANPEGALAEIKAALEALTRKTKG